MTRLALETQVMAELRHLPLAQAKEALDFVIFLRTRTEKKPVQSRPLGLLQGKASCHIAEDFSMTDQAFLAL
jgi:hypothetical protein